jgi:flagellar motor switch protein FliG
MDPTNLIGSLKAAILVHALGWDVVAPMMSQLSKEERNLIFKLQSKMGTVSAELVEGVAKEFLEKVTPPAAVDSTAKRGQRGGSDDLLDDQRSQALKTIQALEPDTLIQLIQNEHPQTISLIVAHLNPHMAGNIMARLPDALKIDVACRIATLDKVSSGMLEEIDQAFAEILANKQTAATQKAGGVSRLAEILNIIDGATAEQIMEEIEENDPDLADEIRQNMFVFDDIVFVDDRGLQKVLRSVESHELAVALKAATDDVKEKIFRNMSERAAQILKEEMEVSGAVRIKDVTDAQQKVTKVVQDMERKGELVVSGRGGEELVG